MPDSNTLSDPETLKHQANDFFYNQIYDKASSLYEQLIEIEPNIKSHYWYLGLALLLQGKEEEAQLTWLFALEDSSFIQDLVEVLENEATAQASKSNYKFVWVIRNHIKEIDASNINNLLQIILFAIKLELFSPEDIENLGILQILNSKSEVSVNHNFLTEILGCLFKNYYDNQVLIDFASACLNYDIHAFLSPIFSEAVKFANGWNRFDLAIKIAEICLDADPRNIEIYKHTNVFLYSNREFSKSVEVAKRCLLITHKIEDIVTVNYLYLRSLIASDGYSPQLLDEIENHKLLLQNLIDQRPTSLDRATTMHLFPSTFLFPYTADDPIRSNILRNNLASMCQALIQANAEEQVRKYNYRIPLSHKPIKVGYVSECLKRHSIGWLARWLFKYHNREDFLIHTYFVAEQNIADSNQQWIAQHSDISTYCTLNGFEIAEKIYQDDIDILVDLDSVTSDLICEALSLKPSPIQVSWLGWDSSGIPAIDYFMADPYILPDNAQDYYSEQIWRLPQTYLAVDGFEVSVPSISRRQLNIADDAIVYLTTQTIYKLYPEIVRNQLQIIKAVNNSYLLIKSTINNEAIQMFVTKIAEEIGLSIDRIRFLTHTKSEEEHRANLGIADIVLDTYPYNGATTTMETLWMCIPMVTRVGQQFSARNSYTMMINAGITEGIAWSDDEYVELGIKFGTDESLRQQVVWKLKQSHKIAPLWNAKQFTRDMENAYKKMWNIYLEKKNEKYNC